MNFNEVTVSLVTSRSDVYVASHFFKSRHAILKAATKYSYDESMGLIRVFLHDYTLL